MIVENREVQRDWDWGGGATSGYICLEKHNDRIKTENNQLKMIDKRVELNVH